MVNKTEFANRLRKILEYHHLTASVFADRIGVQRSSISHILSERNKPSLDFILKVTRAFVSVDIYWLVYGTGSFPAEEDGSKSISPNTLPFDTDHTEGQEEQQYTTSNVAKKIHKIVIFYNDGTFGEYIRE